MKPPAQSPGLNVIENLWSTLDNKIRQHSIFNKVQHKSVLLEECGKIGPEITKKLVQSMLARLNGVIKATGNHTKY